jgi:hypothetical protein
MKGAEQYLVTNINAVSNQQGVAENAYQRTFSQKHNTRKEYLTWTQSTHEVEQRANTANLLARRGTIMQTNWINTN